MEPFGKLNSYYCIYRFKLLKCRRSGEYLLLLVRSVSEGLYNTTQGDTKCPVVRPLDNWVDADWLPPLHKNLNKASTGVLIFLVKIASDLTTVYPFP